MIIAIDFDGTICHTQYPSIGDPIPGALECIRGLYSNGHTLILWTCREGVYLQDAMRWLSGNDVLDCFAYFNANDRFEVLNYGKDCRKVGATLYVDDKSVGCPTKDGVVDWDAIGKAIYDCSHTGRRLGGTADPKGRGQDAGAAKRSRTGKAGNGSNAAKKAGTNKRMGKREE